MKLRSQTIYEKKLLEVVQPKDFSDGVSSPLDFLSRDTEDRHMELLKYNSRPTDFLPWQTLFSGLQITADGDCSHEIKRCLLLERKAMTNLDSTLKSRDITLLSKVHLVKAMVFPVVMFGCESWTIRKAEHWRISAFELWCWRRLLRVPWTARRSNQSTLKEISPQCSLEGLMLSWSSNALATWCEELTY